MLELTALRRHYASLLDDELRDIATTSELEPVAHAVLQSELERRGIRDLDEYRQQMEVEAEARVQQERNRLAAQAKRRRMYAWVWCVVLLLLGIIGAVQYMVGADTTSGLATMIMAAIGISVAGLSLLTRLVVVRFKRKAWQGVQGQSRPTTRSTGRSPADAGSRR